jgi:hypothetical protein
MFVWYPNDVVCHFKVHRFLLSPCLLTALPLPVPKIHEDLSCDGPRLQQGVREASTVVRTAWSAWLLPRARPLEGVCRVYQ